MTTEAPTEAPPAPASSTEADPSYVAAWQRYRKWRRVSLTIFFGWIPYGYITSKIIERFDSDILWPALVLPLMLVYSVSGAGTGFFRCPRCGRHFYIRGLANYLARRCVNCGLPMWAVNRNAG